MPKIIRYLGGIGDILNRPVPGFDWFGTDGSDNDADGKVDDPAEEALIFRNIANLITVRTNVFVVYVMARITEDPARDNIDNDNDGSVDEAGEDDDVRAASHDAADNDGDGQTDEKDEADKLIKILGQQKLVAVVDRSTRPITVRLFRWANDF